jgi:hypothetical protein
MKTRYEHITLWFPAGYTRQHVERLEAEFPGIRVVLNWHTFAMEVDVDGEIPSADLKTVFAWVENHL